MTSEHVQLEPCNAKATQQRILQQQAAICLKVFVNILPTCTSSDFASKAQLTLHRILTRNLIQESPIPLLADMQ